MLSKIKDTMLELVSVIYPDNCLGCNRTLKRQENVLCLRCENDLLPTNHAVEQYNNVYRQLCVRVPINNALSGFYFQKNNPLQAVIHALKYDNRTDAGVYLGRIIGSQLATTLWINSIKAIVPMPLHPKKEHRRGYNQAAHIAKGISEVVGVAVQNNMVKRSVDNPSQTTQSRHERWENVEGIFEITDKLVAGTHLLLVDDVITTGATIEACAMTITASGCEVSVATAATALMD